MVEKQTFVKVQGLRIILRVKCHHSSVYRGSHSSPTEKVPTPGSTNGKSLSRQNISPIRLLGRMTKKHQGKCSRSPKSLDCTRNLDTALQPNPKCCGSQSRNSAHNPWTSSLEKEVLTHKNKKQQEMQRKENRRVCTMLCQMQKEGCDLKSFKSLAEGTTP